VKLTLAEAAPDFARDVLKDGLASLSEARLTVTGSCMAPSVRPGDVVTLVAASQRRPRLGDVVLSDAAEGLRLHRLIWMSARGWRTKADGAPTWDPVRSGADVLATVTELRRGSEVRDPRSAGRLLRSLVGVAIAYARAWRRSLRGR
jgi:hypothetical protein